MTTIAEALDQLVRPDKTVAEVLTEAGCRGEHHARRCPVAVFLTKTTGRLAYAGIALAYEQISPDDWQTTDMPDDVTRFIGDFDAGRHPELEVSDV